MARYTISPGRVLCKDGEPLVVVSREDRSSDGNGDYALSPAETDELVRKMCRLLNKEEEKAVRGVKECGGVIDLKKLREKCEIRLLCKPEDTPIKGNVLSSGDDALDKEFEKLVAKALEDGNAWAWCTAVVEVECGNIKEQEILGCCSYESEEDFRKGDYYEDMVNEALYEVARRMEKLIELGMEVRT